ncbi:DUF554 domain-containing protein [Fictibacillus sp. KIGAM418]|uniref:DUF554 domain-containing protein n=1 Tax=Fictibacillus marinisediminis TaxID=2878389 RepID=A0A9X1XGS0_9BACL|nr:MULTISPECIES: DUF554 domain-containing protein [Fictibacillus]MCK6259373.1 DUF554 domain-containing protein [Fictibacillus marinisediminis]UZJ79008.1 DUF554 domain-containing protein [Fictibacillus sp. KU28468]SFE97655.1 hypothetical protein SAMN05428981_11188 [Bacillus sp. OV194]
MALLGTLVNGLAIVIGSLLGLFWRNIPEKTKVTIMQAMGLAVIILGIGMGLKSKQFLIVIASLAIGGVLGERLDLEGKLGQLGDWLEKKLGGKEKGGIANAFVTATLVFVIGAMSIVGALDSGLRHDHAVLYTKALIDGFCAIFFTSALGVGVIFSAVPVILYQGIIALFATQIDRIVPADLMKQMIVEITGTGGIMILAIGLNILGLTKIRVANLLPALLFTITIVSIVYYWDKLSGFAGNLI